MEKNKYKKIQIGLASPEKILEWSYGEVLKPETINYRTLRPEKSGLFCEKIFGTTKDWECFCGKYKSIRYKKVVCDRCGVEITHSKVRRERMGHIQLASPVVHIWFYKAVPSRIGLLLDTSILVLKSIIYYEKYIITDPGDVSELKKNSVVTEEEYYELQEKYGDRFKAGIGAEVLREMLTELDLEGEAIELRKKMSKSKSFDKRKMMRLKLLEDFLGSSNQPEWMVNTIIPVIPPELRPMVQLEGGRFATSDLNDLYRRLINRNNRLKKLIAFKAPEIIVKNEKRMLQEAVDALYDNSRRKRTIKGTGNRPLKSLSDILKGKQGRFRQNLLGKRVDFSARSVIVVGPELKMHECAIPKKMALELTRPFLMNKLVKKKLAFNVKSAKKLIDKEYPEVWKVLEEVIENHPVILNRAPTLHRLGMQAFKPKLSEGKAIRLHPLVCSSYNADFDGDQMAVHLPLSVGAQIEAWTLMLAPHNLLDPANGKTITNPTQDMILGIYNLSLVKPEALGTGRYFSSVEEVKKAFEKNTLEIQAEIKLYDEKEQRLRPTTLGRIIFSEVIPEEYPIKNIDEVLNDEALSKFINDVNKKCGNYKTVEMLDKLKEIGFHYSTLFANTISLEDILIPDEKEKIIEETLGEVQKNNDNYQNGVISDEERYQKNISLWTYANDKITNTMMTNLEGSRDGFNSLYIMAKSGARGSKQQIRQLAGMRGLMAKPSGDIIDMPIISNFKEGLNVLEYFISTHGARKGLSDTALKTADAGYLTRKLVDISQDVTITMQDCNTIRGIDVHPIKLGNEIIEKLSERVVGRTTAEDIINPFTEEVILKAGGLITEEIADQVDKYEIESVTIFTVVTCDAEKGICQKCYGISLADRNMVNIGEPVGIIASQSIGQPGTQLTMRTFHIGGTASSEVKEPFFKAATDLVIINLPENLIVNSDKKLMATRRVFITLAGVYDKWSMDALKEIKVQDGELVKLNSVIAVDKKGEEIVCRKSGTIKIDEKNKLLVQILNPYQHPVEIGSIFEKEEGEFVKAGKVIYTFDSIIEPIIAEKSGVVRYQDIIVGKTMKEEIDELTGTTNNKIIESKEEKLQPKLIIISEAGEPTEVDIPVSSTLYINDGDEVKTGDILSGRIRSFQKTVDITGGLPRVQELFEARVPLNSAVIAEIDGRVQIGEIKKGKRMVSVINEFGDEIVHVIPSVKAMLVRSDDYIKAGEPLCEGQINPHDILRVSGEKELYRFILRKVQEVYKRQGVDINDKHIGVIVRQMLRKVEVIDPGDTSYIKSEIVDKYKIRKLNQEVVEEGGQPAIVKTILLGLTKASLNTESFVSSAAFQETTKILTNAAIKNSVDDLKGLKENVIIGQKIPAGTGNESYDNVNIYKEVQGDMDYLFGKV